MNESEKLGKKYKVTEGDDLCKIAVKFYENCDLGYKIAEANKLASPDRIEVGQILLIPDLKKQETQKPAPTGQTSSTETKKVMKETTYVVKEGDDLCKIAEKFYGDCSMWPKIAEANDLASPDFLSKGAKLRIPK
jgi:nucleoid-associated protein YgaU